MIFRSTYALVVAALIALASSSVAAADLATYRAFTLGTSVADVIGRSGAAPRDLTKIAERPALLEELSWRLPYRSEAAGQDSVAAIVFSFVDNQLYRMAVAYDRNRTEGLTSQDMIASLSAIYGPRSTRTAPAVPKTALDSLDAPTAVARWRQDDTVIVLTRSAYSGGFGLVITSVKLEAIARVAQATAVTLDAREAPAREAARAKAEAEARRAAEEKTRTTNKDAFKP